jgi:hypothetical protein
VLWLTCVWVLVPLLFFAVGYLVVAFLLMLVFSSRLTP